MALGAIEGNRTRPFDSGGKRRFKALGAIEANRTRPDGVGSKDLHGLGAIEGN